MEEAATRAMVSTATIRTWIAEQRLEAFLYAGRWWVAKDSLATVTPQVIQ